MFKVMNIIKGRVRLEELEIISLADIKTNIAADIRRILFVSAKYELRNK